MSRKCYKCERGVSEGGFASALLRVYNSEVKQETTIAGNTRSIRKTKERWVCVKCLLTRIAKNPFKDALDFIGLEVR